MIKNYFPLLIIFFLPFCAVAQTGEKPVQFLQGNFTTNSNVATQQFKIADIQSSLFKDKYFVLIQFAELPSVAIRKQLKGLGVELETYLSGDAYLASIKSKFDFSLAGHFDIISINALPANYKIDPSVKNTASSFDKEDAGAIGVSFYASFDKATVIKELQALGA